MHGWRLENDVSKTLATSVCQTDMARSPTAIEPYPFDKPTDSALEGRRLVSRH